MLILSTLELRDLGRALLRALAAINMDSLSRSFVLAPSVTLILRDYRSASFLIESALCSTCLSDYLKAAFRT